jgi:hypothetical protein
MPRLRSDPCAPRFRASLAPGREWPVDPLRIEGPVRDLDVGVDTLDLRGRARLHEHDAARPDELGGHEHCEPAEAPAEQRRRYGQPSRGCTHRLRVVLHGRPPDLEPRLQVDRIDDNAGEGVGPAVEDVGAAAGSVSEDERCRPGQAGAGCCSRR